ncbi:DUF2330 domain-containing protein [Paraliomyxa miuraensis]|uniref:DUF2330 domain-containing protein n=1 Tax=Paraliomyxa miuraensis TaxID=376150 RepID=UPI00225036DD|nr:DUF2330 domain-containing protein [Paraliomyxa miuraensis]MCX4242804.1 DUF2330 domain-containing protein [Paraliomyxa miuraensis]
MAWVRRAGVIATMAAGLAVMAPLAPRPARACGGTFCDSGPMSMPVEQTGETILFVIDEGFVEAHIQIQYDPQTNAEKFAWVVPVTALPEFSVGSQQLFANLLATTVPSYGFSGWSEPCGGTFGDDGWDGCDGTGGGGDDGGIKLDVGGPPPPPDEPEVVLATTVGAFEVFVLDGGTVQGVMQWLGDNGFAQDPAAEPILAEYLAEGHLFVAFRLQQDADVAEIHPIALRYAGTEPCVPIRLTRIAAQEDMDIRALFLADSRVSSSNWRHVTLNPLKIDWLGLGVNYRDLVTLAVDEPGANGHAFVTEYAGSSEIVSREGLLGPLWSSPAFGMAPTSVEAAVLLLDQGFYDFDEMGDCVAQHPLIDGLVATYLPVPPGTDLALRCTDPIAYGNAADPLAWDPAAFEAALEERIIVPGQHANALLDGFGYLTRLYTTLSPIEMTEDPMFHPTPDLPEQATLTWQGQRNTFCDGSASFELPDGRLVAMLEPLSWPDIAPGQMPWVETIEYLPAVGAPVVEVDNRDAIAALLEAWNMQYGPPQSPFLGSCHGETTGGPGDGGATVGGPPTGTDTESSGPGANDDLGKGCGCRGGPNGPGGAGGLGLGLLLLGARVRSRHREQG